MLKLFKFIVPMKNKIALMLFLLILQVIGTLYIPTLTASMVNNGIMQGNINHVYKIGVFMIIIAIVISVISITSTY